MTRGQQLDAVLWFKGSSTEKAILFVLDNFAATKGHCWPSIGTIAECAGLAERTVQLAIRDLEARGLLLSQPRRRPDGSATSSVYRINYERLIPPVAPPGAIDSPGGAQYVHQGGAPVAPHEPLIGTAHQEPTPLPPTEVRRGEGGWDRNAAVAEITAAFPPTNGNSSPVAVRDALYALSGPGVDARFPSEAAAAVWLLGRVKAYAASKRGRTTPQDKRPSMKRWMVEAMYDSPDADWAQAYKHAAGQFNGQAAPTGRTGALAAMKANEATLRLSGGATA